MSCSGSSHSVALIWHRSDLTIYNQKICFQVGSSRQRRFHFPVNFMIHGVLRARCLQWSGDRIHQQQSDQRLLDFRVHLQCADTFWR